MSRRGLRGYREASKAELRSGVEVSDQVRDDRGVPCQARNDRGGIGGLPMQKTGRGLIYRNNPNKVQSVIVVRVTESETVK